MMFQILEYLKFLWRSTNQHGVHSPFVYDLVTKCFYDNQAYDDYDKIEVYRNELLQNNTVINITDFGSGSKVFNSNARAISQMAKTSGTTLKRAKLLYRIISYFEPQHILELGTSLGIATHAMALGNPQVDILSIEGCANLTQQTQKQLSQFDITNVTIKTGDISEMLDDLKTSGFDLVFFDANHTKEATLDYFNTLVTAVHNDSVFIFDDIHWSSGMKAAWEDIKDHPSVSVTIDTFFWGFVFFRKEQAKENFSIRV
ncbi:MAG: class I SAM-dependent methyltransferase [Psychroserpens sp.]|nr:class I SAM-dependent methyltransferase [Psychroserpens sp.]